MKKYQIRRGKDITEEKENLLHRIHQVGEEYYSVDHSTGGVSFYEYLAGRLCEIGYTSPEAIERQEQR